MRRNRSGSASTDTKSQTGSTFSSAGANGDETISLSSNHASGTSTPRKILRPSLSAAQLRSNTQPPSIVTTSVTPPDTYRNRSGTNPTTMRPTLSPAARTSSNTSDSRHDRTLMEEPEEYVGPSVQFAKLPELPARVGSPSPTGSVTTPTGRRLPFNLLSKTLSSNDHTPSLGLGSHRRGSSTTSIRGN